MITVDQFTRQIDKLINFPISNVPTHTCYLQQFYTNSTYLCIATVVIPVYEFCVYPILRRHFTWMKSLLKILLGMLLQMARILVLMAFTLNVRYTYIMDNQGHNLTLECIFLEETGALVHTLDSKWLMLPSIIDSMSLVTFII